MTEIANKFPPMSGKYTETVNNSGEKETDGTRHVPEQQDDMLSLHGG